MAIEGITLLTRELSPSAGMTSTQHGGPGFEDSAAGSQSKDGVGLGSNEVVQGPE